MGLTWRYRYTLFDELTRAARHASADPAAPELDWRAYDYDAFGRLRLETGSNDFINSLHYDGEHVAAENDHRSFFGNIRQWYTDSDTTDDLLAITPQAPFAGRFAIPAKNMTRTQT